MRQQIIELIFQKICKGEEAFEFIEIPTTKKNFEMAYWERDNKEILSVSISAGGVTTLASKDDNFEHEMKTFWKIKGIYNFIADHSTRKQIAIEFDKAMQAYKEHLDVLINKLKGIKETK